MLKKLLPHAKKTKPGKSVVGIGLTHPVMPKELLDITKIVPLVLAQNGATYIKAGIDVPLTYLENPQLARLFCTFVFTVKTPNDLAEILQELGDWFPADRFHYVMRSMDIVNSMILQYFRPATDYFDKLS